MLIVYSLCLFPRSKVLFGDVMFGWGLGSFFLIWRWSKWKALWCELGARADGDPAQGKITGVSKVFVDLFRVFDDLNGVWRVLKHPCCCRGSGWVSMLFTRLSHELFLLSRREKKAIFRFLSAPLLFPMHPLNTCQHTDRRSKSPAGVTTACTLPLISPSRAEGLTLPPGGRAWGNW